MARYERRRSFWLGVVGFGASLALSCGQADGVVLVSNGTAACSIVLRGEQEFAEPPLFNWSPRLPLLQWAAEDLAEYLGRIGGVQIPIEKEPIPGLVPIFVGSAPEARGPAAETPYGDAYVVEVSEERIVLHGESRRAVYYAAADLLHSLGVRWYAPGRLGECIPQRSTLTVTTGRKEAAPSFITRRLWCRPPDELRWMYRNRLGEPTIPSGHSLHGFGARLPGWREPGLSVLESRSRYPDYYSLKEGKSGAFINLAHPEIPGIFAEEVIRRFREEGSKGGPGGKRGVDAISLSPDDGFLEDERPEVVAINDPEPDPVLGLPSFSESWFAFLSRVCEEVEKRDPSLDFRIGSLAYMNYLMPPRRFRPNPRILPVVAPITFNRYVSMGTPGAPTSELLVEILKGWAAISPRVGVYLYNFNLADMAMPYTRRVHWTRDLPRLHAMGIRDVTIESHPNWHTMMPGNYVAARLLWDVRTDVSALLEEFYPGYYGPAASAMRGYDAALENAYESSRVLAGGVWGMHRILTPEVMHALEQALREAEGEVQGRSPFEQRVEIVRYSLNFAKIWFAARDALNRGDLEEAERQGEAFLANYRMGYGKYPLFFGKNVSWSPNIERYFELFHHRAFQDAGRIAREARVLYRLPDELPVHRVPLVKGRPENRPPPDPDRTKEWQRMKTFSATLDEQGHPFFRGVLWYWHDFELPPPAGAVHSCRLWFGGVDSKVSVWMNGKEIGEQFAGSFKPVEFDVTEALRPVGTNRLLIAVDNTFPNEIGIGGILRPVLLYAPRQPPEGFTP